MKNGLVKFHEGYNAFEKYVLAISFFIMIIAVFSQVVCREMGVTNSWAEELSRYIYVWECWLGLSFCQRYHRHIRVTVLSDKFPIINNRIHMIIVYLVCLLTTGLMAYYGFQLVIQQMGMGTVSPYLKVPYWIVYISMPISCMIFNIRVITEIISLIVYGKELDVEELDEGVGL